MTRCIKFNRTSNLSYSHHKRLRKSLDDILTFCYRRCWRHIISHKWQLTEKDYLELHQNICDIQIRFNVCDSIRFEKSWSIISLSFCNPFFAEISNIRLTLYIQMLRWQQLRQFLIKSRHFWIFELTKHHNIDDIINNYLNIWCRRHHRWHFHSFFRSQLWIAEIQIKS